MSDHRPPDQVDEALLRQVEDALDQLQLGDGPTKDALLSAVRAALEDLDPDSLGIDLEATLAGLDEGAPSVHIVEGGRDPDTSPSPGAKPDLRVADDPAVADPAAVSTGGVSSHDGEGSELSDDEAAPRVRVIRVTRRAEPSSNGSGQVSLDGLDAWQTIFRGTTPRRYRIRCDRGAIQVALDGLLVEELSPGQTSDFEGAVVRVLARDANGAEGSYWAIGESP